MAKSKKPKFASEATDLDIEIALDELSKEFESLMSADITQENTMSQLGKFTRVNDSFTVNRYDNGWMVEIGGRNKKDDWVSAKILCNTESELIALIQEYNQATLVE
jgi:hypothetical protein